MGRLVDEALDDVVLDDAPTEEDVLGDNVGAVVEDSPASDVAEVFAVSLVEVGKASSPAEGGSTTWLSTTDTPAHATPTAAALAISHIENSMSFFMRPVSQALVG